MNMDWKKTLKKLDNLQGKYFHEKKHQNSAKIIIIMLNPRNFWQKL